MVLFGIFRVVSGITFSCFFLVGVMVLLLCLCAEFKPSGEIILHLHRKHDNGVETVILNKEHQIPVVEVMSLLILSHLICSRLALIF